MSAPTLADPAGCQNPADWVLAREGQYPLNAPLYVDPSSGWCYPYRSNGRPNIGGAYGYDPSQAAAIAFVTLFALFSFIYAGLTIKSHRAWLTVTVLGGLFEMIGWIGRLLSSQRNDFSNRNRQAFIINIVCLTFAPAFFSGTIDIYYIYLVSLRRSHSALSPRKLLAFCVGVDIVAILVQACGGAVAGSNQDNLSTVSIGTDIILAGVVIQLVSTVVFLPVFADFYRKARGSPLEVEVSEVQRQRIRTEPIELGILAGCLLIILRNSYRIAEMAGGWTGRIATTERYFIAMDATMMIICLAVLTAAHPVFWLPNGVGTLASPAKQAKRAEKERQKRIDSETSTPPSTTQSKA